MPLEENSVSLFVHHSLLQHRVWIFLSNHFYLLAALHHLVLIFDFFIGVADNFEFAKVLFGVFHFLGYLFHQTLILFFGINLIWNVLERVRRRL